MLDLFNFTNEISSDETISFLDISLPPQTDKPISVSQYNDLLHDMLCETHVVVDGEISELNIWQGKYAYLTLKDTSDQNVTTNAFGVLAMIRNIKKFQIGDHVDIFGYPGVHNKSGRLSLQIEKIEKIDEGVLVKKRNDLIEKLISEGIISDSRKRTPQRIYNRVALITAVPSQAYNDFIKIYNSRWGQGRIDVIKSKMQGMGSDISVILALKELNRSKVQYDAVVIARGGGSREDLISFDSEELAYQIFASRTPVVAAIGHEGDISIADMVADLRASTPSNAAELLTVPDKTFLINKSDNFIYSIQEKVNTRIENIADISNRLFGDCLYNFTVNLDKYEKAASNIAKVINTYDINKTLNRGYSLITDKDENIITEHDKIDPTNTYNIYMKNGKSKKYKIVKN